MHARIQLYIQESNKTEAHGAEGFALQVIARQLRAQLFNSIIYELSLINRSLPVQQNKSVTFQNFRYKSKNGNR